MKFSTCPDFRVFPSKVASAKVLKIQIPKWQVLEVFFTDVSIILNNLLHFCASSESCTISYKAKAFPLPIMENSSPHWSLHILHKMKYVKQPLCIKNFKSIYCFLPTFLDLTCFSHIDICLRS